MSARGPWPGNATSSRAGSSTGGTAARCAASSRSTTSPWAPAASTGPAMASSWWGASWFSGNAGAGGLGHRARPLDVRVRDLRRCDVLPRLSGCMTTCPDSVSHGPTACAWKSPSGRRDGRRGSEGARTPSLDGPVRWRFRAFFRAHPSRRRPDRHAAESRKGARHQLETQGDAGERRCSSSCRCTRPRPTSSQAVFFQLAGGPPAEFTQSS